MSDTPDINKQDKTDDFQDKLIVRHPEGKSEKLSLPEGPDKVLRIGRELDNDIVLTDPRASRYHAELRRAANGEVQIKDLNSANGILLGVNRIKADAWEKIEAGQVVQFGETRLIWEKAASSQSTVAMTPIQKQRVAEQTAGNVVPPPVVPARQESKLPIPLPWLIGIGVLLVLLLLAFLSGIFIFSGDSATTPVAGGPIVEGVESPQETVERESGADLAQQTPGGAPTETPTPSGPQLAIPNVVIQSSEVRPIILGALPSTDKALYLVSVRVQNLGNAPFVLSTEDFSLQTDDGESLAEAGGNTSTEGLTRLGVVDRFDNLNLTPGGSVSEDLIFEVGPEVYNFDLLFEPADVDPVILSLGTVNAGLELAVALGTPVAEETPTTIAAAAASATPTLEPTPTATRPAAIPAPQVVPRSALRGTIAYPVFNGNDYDVYFGKPDGSGKTQFYRGNASQPAFNADGSRIAFHSWGGGSQGLIAIDVSGANGYLIANFVEDQLPVWSADSQDIIFLTRRSGGRQSEIMKADSNTELPDAIILGEGEYPSVGANGRLAFKGWGNTAFGLRVGSDTFSEIETVTNADEDTAPALSPDGSKVVFMSRREENWDIYVVNTDGSDLQRLTTDAADDGLPTWSPDGNAIAFVSNRGGPWAVWVMTPDSSGLSQLFTMQGSPDGQVGTDTYASRGWGEERISWTAAELVE